MDFSKFGLRNIIGYAFPGAAILILLGLTLYATLFSIVCILSGISFISYITFFIDKLSLNGSILFSMLFFLFSYFIGSILRLSSADDVDDAAAISLLKDFRIKFYSRINTNKDSKSEPNKKETADTSPSKTSAEKNANPPVKDFEIESIYNSLISAKNFLTILDDKKLRISGNIKKFKNDLLNSRLQLSENEKIELIWIIDMFPFSNWEKIKFSIYHPLKVNQFFHKFEDNLFPRINPSGKEFFNFCKMVIFNKNKTLTDSVVDEINHTETVVRFFAGLHCGLKLIKAAAIYSSIFQSIVLLLWLKNSIGKSDGFMDLVISLIKSPGHHILGMIVFLSISGVIALFSIWAVKKITNQFRFLRIKEVDAVYDAFCLINNSEII